MNTILDATRLPIPYDEETRGTRRVLCDHAYFEMESQKAWWNLYATHLQLFAIVPNAYPKKCSPLSYAPPSDSTTMIHRIAEDLLVPDQRLRLRVCLEQYTIASHRTNTLRVAGESHAVEIGTCRVRFSEGPIPSCNSAAFLSESAIHEIITGRHLIPVVGGLLRITKL